MKSALFRRVLFAVVVVGGCGDKPQSSSEVAPEMHRVVPVQATAPQAPASAPVVKTELPAPMPVPTDYADAMKLGKAAAAKQDVAVARAMFDAASRFDDASAEPQIELARLFIDSGDKKLALASAKKATKLAPESSAAWNTLGRAQLARFAYDDAITAFEKALDKNPKNAFAWNNLGFTMLELELWSEARNALEEATALPDAAGYMFNNLGLAYEHLEMFEEARTAFEQGGEHGSAAAKYNRGRLEGVDEAPQVATAKVVISPDVTVVEDSGQVEEAAIVDEAVKAEADDDATVEDTVTDESSIDDGTDVPDEPVDDGADEEPTGTKAI